MHCLTDILNRYMKSMGLPLNGKVPREYGSEFRNSMLEANLKRELMLACALILMDLILLSVDLIELRKLWLIIPACRLLFYLHTALFPVMAPYFLLHYIRKARAENKKYRKVLHYYSVFAALAWCTALGITAQLIPNQISPYIVGVFCISSIILLRPAESRAIILSSYLTFLTGVFMLDSDRNQLLGLATNSGIMTVMAYLVSRACYFAYVNDFLSKKIIIEKTKQLESAYKHMEDKVRTRTEELTKSNMQLVSEISCKYEAELRIAKIELMYKEKEQLLRAAMEYDKLRTEFFANLSHELRTPLNIIYCVQQMLAGLVKRKQLGEDGAKVDRYLGVIRQNCFRLLRLIGNMIDITKIDSGFFEMSVGNHDIVKVVEDITLSVADYTEQKNIILTFDTELEEKVIACDPDKIERVLLNLFSNAVKFTPENGCIYVNIYNKKGEILISVRDTGIGIPEEKLTYVFDRFMQIDKSLSRSTEGSGIGLSLVKSLVEMHGGTIAVHSGKNKGTEFVIALPDRQLNASETAACAESCQTVNNVERISIEFSDIYM